MVYEWLVTRFYSLEPYFCLDFSKVRRQLYFDVCTYDGQLSPHFQIVVSFSNVNIRNNEQLFRFKRFESRDQPSF